MPFQEQQLAQARENSTNAASIYSPGTGITALIKTILIANQSGAAATYRLFLDNDGTTYDQGTCLAYDVPIDANSTHYITVFMAMNNSSGNLAYRSSAANALTITVFGAEVS